MKKFTERGAGTALLIGVIFMLATMVLHPSGGNLQQLLNITRVTIISHSMAIFAIPFLCVGFWGLLKHLSTIHFFPLISFAMMLTGLLAGMIAAIINGIAVPIYIQNYSHATEEIARTLKPTMLNNFALNQAFDFVFLGAISSSILFWSVSIIQLRKMPLWIGYFGMVLSLTVFVMMAFGYVFVNLHGFRLFIFLTVLWISIVGITLFRLQPNDA